MNSYFMYLYLNRTPTKMFSWKFTEIYVEPHLQTGAI